MSGRGRGAQRAASRKARASGVRAARQGGCDNRRGVGVMLLVSREGAECHAERTQMTAGVRGSAARERLADAVEELATVEGWRTAYPLLDEAGPAARDVVRRGLAHPHPRVRQWCAALLDHHADERSIPGLLRVLDDPVAAVRRHALHSLGCQPCKTAPLAIDVVPLLLHRAAHDVSVRVRRRRPTCWAVSRTTRASFRESAHSRSRTPTRRYGATRFGLSTSRAGKRRTASQRRAAARAPQIRRGAERSRSPTRCRRHRAR